MLQAGIAYRERGRGSTCDPRPSIEQ